MNKSTRKIKSESDFSFYLLGISSSESDFKLCWRINQDLNIDFIREDDLVIFNEKLKAEQLFSLYSFSTEDYQAFLISNKATNGFLLDEHKNIDFLIKFSSEDSAFFDMFYSKLKQIEVIQASFKIDVNSLKSKQKLIF